MSTKTVRVELGERGYDVRVGRGLLETLGEGVAALGGVSRAAVISDQTVAGLYGQRVLASLRAAGLTADLLAFPAGEPNKTLATAGRLFDKLFALAPAVDRSSVVVALGGGVPGDVAGFVAATALRGLRWVQAPTTLLADVDASVGGKTAVDHPAGKNLIGAFHQPRGVWIDVETLATLDARQVRAGLAECVKHGVIRDAALLDLLEGQADALLACRPGPMTELIARNVAIKAAVVAADEREAGQRAHLNFGHTVGHALETLLGLGALSHGEAVALGMVAANALAVRRGLLDADDAGRVAALLERLGLPVRRGGLDPDTIWRIMQHDKKARGGKVRMVLAEALGRVGIYDDVTAAEVAAALEELGACQWGQGRSRPFAREARRSPKGEAGRAGIAQGLWPWDGERTAPSRLPSPLQRASCNAAAEKPAVSGLPYWIAGNRAARVARARGPGRYPPSLRSGGRRPVNGPVPHTATQGPRAAQAHPKSEIRNPESKIARGRPRSGPDRREAP